MKKTFCMLIALVGYSFGVPIGETNTEDYSIKSDQQRERQIQELAQECAVSIEKAVNLSPDQSIPQLGYTLKRLGGWQRPDTLTVYNEAQSKLLSIPSHATYYRNKIKAAQAEVKAGRMTLNVWSRLRIDSFQTLQHLPSEETVEVLIGFLEDNFACADSRNPEDYQIPGLESYREWDMSVRAPAASSLANLGIENPPGRTDSHIDGGGVRRGWIQWWNEVKAGKRKYRFKGSSVEHPVNAPPGTAREVRRPERHSEPPSKEKTTPIPVQEPPRSEREKGPQWSLFAAIAAAMVAVMLYFIKRKGRE
jgi:hypothetical protein